MASNRSTTPTLLKPAAAVWRLFAILIDLTCRLAAVVIGATLMLGGGLLCLTVIGAIIGIPLAVLGLVIVLRGMF